MPPRYWLSISASVLYTEKRDLDVFQKSKKRTLLTMNGIMNINRKNSPISQVASEFGRTGGCFRLEVSLLVTIFMFLEEFWVIEDVTDSLSFLTST